MRDTKVFLTKFSCIKMHLCPSSTFHNIYKNSFKENPKPVSNNGS